MLATAGFKNVSSMEGGIHAWQGLTATGAPESGMAHFPETASAADLIVLSWLLEEGSRKFYTELPKHLEDQDATHLFTNLVAAEERHKHTLAGLYRSFTDTELDGALPRFLRETGARDEVMEGGVGVSESLIWARGRSLTDILEFALGLEANSYDLYIKMGRRVRDEKAKNLFSLLSSEEKNHLERLAGLLDTKI